MRLPKKPPKWGELLLRELPANGKRLFEPNPTIRDLVAQANNESWNWEDCGYRAIQAELSPEQLWIVVKLSRQSDRRATRLMDNRGRAFSWRLSPSSHRILHIIDTNLGGMVGSVVPKVSSEEEKTRYLLTSLREEAIASSLIEGAVATREQAKEMIRSNRKPQSVGERMILNNYRTIKHLNEQRNRPLTQELLIEVQEMLTRDTLERPDASGRYRRSDERITVWDDEDQQDLHVPPAADELPERMQRLCEFANAESEGGGADFIHPAIRAIILHFWLAYDHPFVDGNGRTARALFYWSMLRQGYWLAEFLSISKIIALQPKQYARAFLNSETDENDLSYFIHNQLDVVERSVVAFRDYVESKRRDLDRTLLLRSNRFNSRQRAILDKALKDLKAWFSYETHANSHAVVLATARTDLLELANIGLLVLNRSGRRYVFRPADNLEQRLKYLGRRSSSG